MNNNEEKKNLLPSKYYSNLAQHASNHLERSAYHEIASAFSHMDDNILSAVDLYDAELQKIYKGEI